MNGGGGGGGWGGGKASQSVITEVVGDCNH